MVRTRTSVLAVLLAAAAAVALFAGVCNFVGPARQHQREVDASRSFSGVSGPDPAPLSALRAGADKASGPVPAPLPALRAGADKVLMEQSAKVPQVVIAGGGPAGLLCALMLGRGGVRTVLLEKTSQTEEWSSRSYSINLNPRGMAALAAAGVLENVQAAAIERRVMLSHSADGSQTIIPRDPPHLAITRPSLVKCLLAVVRECPLVEVCRGKAVTGFTQNEGDPSLQVELEDGTHLCASHLIAADGKWSLVRAAMGCSMSTSKVRTEPSWGVHMNMPSLPLEWRADATHVFKTASSLPCYAIAAPLPDGACSLSIVCFDELLDAVPSLAPAKLTDQWSGSAIPELSSIEDALSSLLDAEFPHFSAAVGREPLASVQIFQRVSWLDNDPDSMFCDAEGRVALIGDAAHSMTPSMGEGCNCALESAAALVAGLPLASTPEQSPSQGDITEVFLKYGRERPSQVRPVQERSAAASRFVKIPPATQKQ